MLAKAGNLVGPCHFPELRDDQVLVRVVRISYRSHVYG
jgi:hypothetical protein